MTDRGAAEAAAPGLSGAHTDAEPAAPDLFGVWNAADARRTELPQPTGAGRPRGAANKVTSRLKDYATALGYRDPALTLAALQSEDVHVLAAKLQCKPVEAAELIRKAAVDLMPYYHRKQPVAVELPEGTRPIFAIEGELVGAVGGAGEAMSLDDDGGEENQGVTPADPAGSDAGGSDDAG